MKHVRDILLFALLAIALIEGFTIHRVEAQSAKAGTLWGQGPLSTCDVSVAAGPAGLCVGSDGVAINPGNGGAWVKLPFTFAGSATITINGTQKTLPAAFTISAGPTTATVAAN
jgi:hypothetical protein